MDNLFATNFTSLDWGIVVVYLIGVGLIGVLANRYIHNVSSYMVAGRGTNTSLNIATYIGTGLGLVTIMYASIDGFQRGFSYLMLAILGFAVGLFLGGTGFVIRRLRELKLVTVTEYFDRRFDRRTRVTAGAICALAGILNMGLFPKMGATFITYSTGLAAVLDDPTVTVNIVTSILIVMVLVYTVMGGMVSVIVTDYLQFVILSIGLGIGLLYVLFRPDLGWTNIISTLSEYKGEAAFNPVHADSYGWLYMVWMGFVFLAAALAWAPEATRALTAKDPETTKRTFLLSAPGQWVRLAIPAFLAMAAFTMFSQDAALAAYFFPDGAAAKAAHADQAMPLLVGKLIPAGVLGILVAGLMAAFMSTHDSYFLCWASVIVRDVVNPLRRIPLTDRQQIRLTRIIIVFIGVFLLGWGVWYPLPDSVWTYMAVTGNIYLSGAATILVGGMYWKRASCTGAFAALVGGLFSIFGVFLDPIKVRFPWLTEEMLGVGNYVFCILIFIVFSLLFPDREAPRHEEA